MKIDLVDPRDVNWEIDYPIFRVYVWHRPKRTSYEYEITDASLDEVLSWARERTREPGWAYTLYARVDDGVQRGLVRLDGAVGDPFA